MSASPGGGWQALVLRRGLGACLLWPLSCIYGGLLALRRWGYRLGWLRRERLDVPVVVIGNVVVGGTGKTPVTVAVVQWLRQHGWTPGVVSRGHGRRDATVRAVLDDTDPALGGDEPLLIRRATGAPVWVGARRALAARALRAAHPGVDVIVCDDGLQHWALASDVRVAVFDDRGTGNGWLLPAGLLREPWPVADANHAPHLVLRAGDGPTAHLPLPPGLPAHAVRRRLAPWAVNRHGERRPLHAWRGAPFTAVAGIARPQAYFGLLASSGLHPARRLVLPDHAEAQRFAQALAGVAGPVLCTEKDLAKIAPPVDAWAVPLVLDIDPAFFAALGDHLERAR